MTCGNRAFATWGSWVRIPSSPPRYFKGRSYERPFYLPLREIPALQLGLQSSLAYRQYASLLFQANLKRCASARCPGSTSNSFIAQACFRSGDCLACFVLPDKMPFRVRQVQIGCKCLPMHPFLCIPLFFDIVCDNRVTIELPRLESVSTCWAKSCPPHRWRGRGRHRAARWPRTAPQRAARHRAR